MATNSKSPVTGRQTNLPGTSDPVSNGYDITVTDQSNVGTDFNGDWPSDGFILPGCATADQGAGRGQFKMDSGAKGKVAWKGGRTITSAG